MATNNTILSYLKNFNVQVELINEHFYIYYDPGTLAAEPVIKTIHYSILDFVYEYAPKVQSEDEMKCLMVLTAMFAEGAAILDTTGKWRMPSLRS